MTKNLLRPFLWGILTFSLLSSCRTEDNISKQNQEDKRFATFTSKSGETINYANGFASLMIKYDDLNKSNLSGIANKPILSSSSDKSTSTATGSYIEFNVRSQVMKNTDGNIWVVFPKVENGNVTSLIVSLLSEKETKLSYYTIDKNDEFYKTNAPSFQEAYNRYKKRNMRLALSASASIQFMANNDCDNRPDERCREIEEVIITNPRPIKTPNKDLTLPSGDQTDNGIPGGDCGSFGDCLGGGGGGGGTGTGTPQQDLCSQAKAITSKDNVKKAIEELTKKMNDLQKKNGNEQIYVLGKDGGAKVIEGGQNHVIFSPDIYTQGSIHDHDSKGFPMFPPHDINSFINTVRVQNYPQNPNDTRDKSGEAFLGIVTPNGNYFMTFNGTKNDIPPMRGVGEVDALQFESEVEHTNMQMHNVVMTDDVLQKLFFDYLDKMGLSGKVNLIKQINGNNYPITKNPDGTINNNSTNPCKN